VVGVVEVYRVPVALFDSIAAGSRLVWSSALLGGLFLYGALFWIVWRAGFLIRRQHEQLVESESLAAVGEMASAITHSIRNSLASIRSSAEVLLEGGDIRHSDEAAQDIVGESDSVEAGIRELLAYSQPLSYSPEPLQGNEVIRHSLQHFERVIAKHHIVVDLDLEESTLLFQGDVVLLGQVFEGLIANALDAMSSGGTLTIKNHLTADGKNARIKIADTGQGVPSDQVDKVFQPFYTTKSSGLGIGLSLIQRIVKRHGGNIELTSRQGQGTEVCVQLPVLN
jgi:signal transduction histidine kinase